MKVKVLGVYHLTVTEDEEAADTEKDVPDDSFTVPSNITGRILIFGFGLGLEVSGLGLITLCSCCWSCGQFKKC